MHGKEGNGEYGRMLRVELEGRVWSSEEGTLEANSAWDADIDWFMGFSYRGGML